MSGVAARATAGYILPLAAQRCGMPVWSMRCQFNRTHALDGVPHSADDKSLVIREKKMLRQFLYGAVAGTFALAGTAAIAASQIVLGTTNIIGSSASYSAYFLADNIFDQQLGLVTDQRPVGTATYWLSADTPGTFGPYITVDLGQPASVSRIDLFNTHNSTYFDRGTGQFTVLAGNTVSAVGAANFRLTGTTVTLAAGTLLPEGGLNPVAQSFNSLDLSPYRYLSFVPITASSLNTPSGANAFGLSEMKVYVSVVPEAPVMAMLLAGLPILLWRRRHHGGSASGGAVRPG